MIVKLDKDSNSKNKLLGIDIFRGIAAYGVVLIHGLGNIPRDESTHSITNFFLAFCVPFFLATSLYLSIKSMRSQDTKTYIVNRVKRIVIPYFAWSIIYFIARLLASLIGNEESLYKLVNDPINLIFFGASSLQLYFLPMLFCGVLTAIPITNLLRKIRSNLLVILIFLLSIYISNLTFNSGNDFVLGEGIAFQHLIKLAIFDNSILFQLIRLILVILAWIIRCMPYIIFGFIINEFWIIQEIQNSISRTNNIYYVKLIKLFLLPALLIAIMLYNLNLAYLLLPYISLLYAIFISELISQSPIISLTAKKIGYFSFGIYLFHALITAGFLPIINKFYPQIVNLNLSPLMLISASGIIFFVSLAVTYLISLNKIASRILLGA